MPRDYRRSAPSQPSKRNKQGKSCIWWLIVGVALGVVVTKILAPGEGDTKPAGEGETVTVPAEPGKTALPKPSFRFEEILTHPESDSRRASAPPRPAAPAPQKPTAQRRSDTPTPTPVAPPPVTPEPVTKPASGTYVVQVGSFSRASDAERLKAQLALLGVSTSVQAATLSNGRVTHRVRTGGFASRQEAQRVQSLLKRHGKDSLAIPVR